MIAGLLMNFPEYHQEVLIEVLISEKQKQNRRSFSDEFKRDAVNLIVKQGYRQRLESVQATVQLAGLDLFIVSAFDSIYYLTDAGFEPLERPFFLLVRPAQAFSRANLQRLTDFTAKS